MAKQPQGKIFLYNYDAIQALDDTPICIALSPKTIALCLASVEYGRWAKRWQSLVGTTINTDTIEGITDRALSELMNESEACMCCDETNELLRQVSIMTNTNTSITYQNNYTGTPQSIAENLPDNFDGGSQDDYTDDEFDTALCQAVTEFMYTALQDAATRLGIFSVAAAALALLAWAFSPVLGYIGTAIVGLVVGDLQAALENEQAIKNVICCALKGLRGQAITHENLQNALDACDFTDPDEQTLVTVWQAFTISEDNYLAFLGHYGRVLNNPSTLANECPCCDAGADHRIDYQWFIAAHQADGVTIQRYPSMRWTSPTTLEITTGRGYRASNNAYKYWFRFYSPSECCGRFQITSPALNWGSGNYYPPVGQDWGKSMCGASTNNNTNDPNQWFCSEFLEFRWTTASGAGLQSTFDTIVLEFDPDYVC